MTSYWLEFRINCPVICFVGYFSGRHNDSVVVGVEKELLVFNVIHYIY